MIMARSAEIAGRPNRVTLRHGQQNDLLCRRPIRPRDRVPQGMRPVSRGGELSMKAAINRSVGAPLTIETVEMSEPGPGEVEVRVKACAICHSDIIFIDGGWGEAVPAVWGHEAAGEVVGVGAGVADVALGDPVVVTMVRACGTCPCCAMGLYGSCAAPHPRDAASPLRDASGTPLIHGMKTAAFAERAIVDRSQIVPIEGEIGWAEASLLACGVITGYGAVKNTARMPAGASAVVIGAGGVGLNAVQGAALRGASKVIVIDISEEKLEIARALGATHCINGATQDPVEAVRKLTHGGADFVFVTVGAHRARSSNPTRCSASAAPRCWSASRPAAPPRPSTR